LTRLDAPDDPADLWLDSGPGIGLRELAEHSAPVLAEVELHEEWVQSLGKDAEREFHQLLEDDGRKLREWLNEPRTRPQAMRAVRQEIRRRRSS
jgi:hypothetical protein